MLVVVLAPLPVTIVVVIAVVAVSVARIGDDGRLRLLDFGLATAEAARAPLADGPDAAAPGAVELWYYDVTEAGRTVLAARTVMQDTGAPFPLWFYLARGTR